MDEFQKHYNTLGLAYGAGPDAVKKAFRSKIKEHHPDRASDAQDSEKARNLIEAYQALKKGPPPPQYTSRPGGAQPAGPRPAASSGPGPRPAADQSRSTSYTYERGHEAGQRLYEKIFKDRQGPMDDFWERVSDLVWGDDGEAEIYGEHVDVREYVHRTRKDQQPRGPFKNPFENQKSDPKPKTPPRKDPPPYAERRHYEHYTEPASGSLDQARVYFNRAETLLRETVYKYDRKKELKRKIWLKEYLSRLNNVLILFRDVANRHPTYYAKANSRIKQINELSSEIRQML